MPPPEGSLWGYIQGVSPRSVLKNSHSTVDTSAVNHYLKFMAAHISNSSQDCHSRSFEITPLSRACARDTRKKTADLDARAILMRATASAIGACRGL